MLPDLNGESVNGESVARKALKGKTILKSQPRWVT